MYIFSKINLLLGDVITEKTTVDKIWTEYIVLGFAQVTILFYLKVLFSHILFELEKNKLSIDNTLNMLKTIPEHLYSNDVISK